jgi:general secretion pathway protein L
MRLLRQIGEGFSRWIDSVAATVLAVLGWLASPRTVKLVEQDNGELVLQAGKHPARDLQAAALRIADGQIVGAPPPGLVAALRGSRAELVLQPGRFLFRPLELPGRAAEFLGGIVRAQIDRLTPWSAADAVFGWSKPADAGPDRIVLTVAASARALVSPYVKAIASLGVQSIAVSTLLADRDGSVVSIKVLEEQARGVLDLARVRRSLLVVVAVASLAAVGSLAAAAIVGGRLDAEQADLSRRIANQRAASRAARDAPLDTSAGALRLLERRKVEAPSGVMALETLSQILPDHTYVTELRIEGDKLRVVGITRDAPALIGLIEQSARFTRATFFAPTTRAPSDPGERFHIEARIEPAFAPRS